MCEWGRAAEVTRCAWRLWIIRLCQGLSVREEKFRQSAGFFRAERSGPGNGPPTRRDVVHEFSGEEF